MNDLKKIINVMIPLSLKAGREIMKFYSEKIVFEEKPDSSPVTEADKLADKLICNELSNKFPEIMLISEESYTDKKLNKLDDIFFLIDPLDGTKEFIEKKDEFTVNIALIIKNKAKLGVIYAPAKKILFYTDIKQNSYQIDIEDEEKDIVFKNSKKIQVSNRSSELTIVTSRSHNNYKTERYIQKNKIINKKVCGSSLKFCLIANGSVDIYPRYGPTREWDTAAGQAILQAAGGSVKELNGNELLYGKTEEDLLNREFIASNF